MFDDFIGVVFSFGLVYAILLFLIFLSNFNDDVPRSIDIEISSRLRSLSRDISKLRKEVKKHEKE